jgi:hypothetical protein
MHLHKKEVSEPHPAQEPLLRELSLKRKPMVIGPKGLDAKMN